MKGGAAMDWTKLIDAAAAAAAGAWLAWPVAAGLWDWLRGRD